MSEQHMALEGQTLEHFSVDLPKERARRQYEQYGEREATQGKSLKNALLLVDGSSYLYRAWHAMPDLRGPNAEPTGALYGFISMLRRLRTEYPAQYSACIFDAKAKPSGKTYIQPTRRTGRRCRQNWRCRSNRSARRCARSAGRS